MNLRSSILTASVVLLLTTNSAWSMGRLAPLLGIQPTVSVSAPERLAPPPGIQPKKPASAPEIDASTGGSALALLAGVVVFLKERRRSREKSIDV